MYKRILVGVDDSEVARRALTEALELARESGAALRIVHAVDVMLLSTGEVYMDLEAYRRERVAAGQEVLQRAAAIAREAGVEVDTALVEVEGTQYSNAIIAEARAWSAELIVLGTHGRGALAHLLMGSVAERVVRHSPVPVLLVKGSKPSA
jgi:nucleotide-binding universal stress UspA family protein